MSTMKCLRKSSFQICDKFSARKFLNITKVVKPILKLMNKKNRTNAVTPSTCNYDIVESFQNDVNESELFQLKFKFFEECDEADENLKNEELERRLLQELSSQNETFHLVKENKPEQNWAPGSDFDISPWKYVTCGQPAEQQVAVIVN